MTWLDFFAQNAWKATVLLTAVFAANLALRRSTAALRHFLWTALFGALLILPLAISLTPKWGWRTQPVTVATVRVRQTAGPVAPAAPASRPIPLTTIWAIGFAVTLFRFAAGGLRTARMLRRAVPADYAAATSRDIASELGINPVRLLETSEAALPLACGIVHPAVVLPADASTWPQPRLQTVLLHELVHIRRRDLFSQNIAHAACCLYWFHPLAWLAARAQRIERERACDDAVLSNGVAAHDYAGHLVDVVKGLSKDHTGWSGAAAMAETSNLESRVRALLDRTRARHPLSRRAGMGIAASIAALLIPLAVLTSHAQATRAQLAGVVRDPSGAVIPNCQIVAKNVDGSNEETTKCGADGAYRFAAIPAGKYAIEVRAAGFVLLKAQLDLKPGEVTRLDPMMSIGALSETVQVVGQKPPGPPSPRTASPQRIRVGGNIKLAKLISRMDPVYPPDAQQEGLEGTVRIRAVVSKNGDVLNPQVINTVDPRLANAALNAVAQWHYEPALLNGQPVELLVSMDVDFKLKP